MPSEQYGTPQQYSSQDSQGYNYDRNALDELLNQVNIAFPLLYFPKNRNHAFFERALVICVYNIVIFQEPANYDFGYKVNDLESGSDFGHSETRQENRAEGSYFVVLPDGTKQVMNWSSM